MNLAAKDRKTGFTLIEMVIVLVIASIIISVILALAKPYYVEQQRQRTINAVRSVEQAMADYVEAFDSYPCPAPLDSARGTNLDGASSCVASAVSGQLILTANGRGGRSILIGALPYRDLDIPVDATIDAFGNRLTYAVSLDSTVPAPAVPTAGAYVDDLSDLALHSGAIDIVDGGATPTSLLKEQGTAHFFYFSHGRNGAGAYTDAGSAYGLGCAADIESENCDDDAVFVAADFSRGSNAQYYDDVSTYSLLVDGEEDDLWDRTPVNSNDIYNLNTGNVGVGTNEPWANLTVSGRPGQDIARIVVVPDNETQWTRIGAHANSDNRFPSFLGVRSRGTPTAPTYALDGDVISAFRGWGWGVNAGSSGAGMDVVAAENFGSTVMGSSLVFKTVPLGTMNNAESMRITAEGRVGIGTDQPVSTLNVYGNSVFDLAHSGCPGCAASITIRSMIDNGGAYGVVDQNQLYGALVFAGTDDFNRTHVINDTIVASIRAVAAERFNYAGPRGTHLKFNTTNIGQAGDSEKMRITADGNVGVGTDNPQAKLHVEGSVRIYDDAEYHNNLIVMGANNGGADFGSIGAVKSGQRETTNGTTAINGNGAQGVGLALSGKFSPFLWPHVYISQQGNLGVGTTTPSNKFEVSNNNGRQYAGMGDGGLELYRSASSGAEANNIAHGYIDFKSNPATDYEMRIQYHRNYGILIHDNVGVYNPGHPSAPLPNIVIGNAANNGNVGINTTATDPNYELYVNGDIKTEGQILAENGVNTAWLSTSSDKRLKSDLTDAPGIETLVKIKGQTYRWNEHASESQKGKLDTGVIAQDLKAIPELAHLVHGSEGDLANGETLSVNYNGLIPVLIESVKDLRAENAALKTALNETDDRVAALENRFNPRQGSTLWLLAFFTLLAAGFLVLRKHENHKI